MNCPECNAVLLVEMVPAASSIRCAACSNIAPRNSAFSAEANRFAWRSFWLGLSSIVLLLFTGIPAIWYGVRSLLEMRYTQSQKHDRKAAVAGISLGVLFGILGSGLLTVIGGFALIISLAIEDSSDPERIREISESIATVELPDGFEPSSSRSIRDQFRRVTWQDGSTLEKANARIRFMKVNRNSQVGGQQLGRPVINFQLHPDMPDDDSPEESTKLTWKFAGKDHEVVRLVRDIEGEDFETVRFTAVTDQSFDEQETWAIVGTFRRPGKYTEDDFRKIFESFEPNQ